MSKYIQLINKILNENAGASINSMARTLLGECSTRCQKSIKNGPNYNFQVQVCSSQCRIKAYMKLINKLHMMRGSFSQQAINRQIKYFTIQLQKEKMKYASYRTTLKKRQTKTPSNLSMKPTKVNWKSN
jgi:hypothetical protein